MTRTTLWPVAGVCLAAAILVFVGCHSDRSTQPSRKSAPVTAAAQPAMKKGLDAWPTPAAVLLISGEQDGYLEPCGCTEGQQGGLGRRYDLIERLRAKGWPVASIDLGSLADAPAARCGPVQTRVKFSVALRALAAMNYAALALSAEDMKLGVAEVLLQYVNQGGDPKVVAANVAPVAGFETAVVPSVTTSAGPFKIGITAVLDPATYQALNDPDKDLLSVSDPAEKLPAVLADLESSTNVQVLMVQGPPAKAKELARAFPGFELVVATSEVADPGAQPEMLNDGKTSVIQVGKKGKYVGAVGIFQDSERTFRYQLVNLNRDYQQAEPIRKLLDQELQSELKTLKIVEDYTKHDYVGGAPGATYIGAESCKTCHPRTYARWASTKHALAYEGLTKPERNREYDAECASCHTTGFEYTSGYRSTELTPHLKGNQCENCHGPGSKHATEPDNPEIRKLMSLPVANPDQNRFCYRCHDEDNSPHFNFVKYYPQIIHKKMDTYDDPNVHQGIVPKLADKSR